MRFFRYNPRFVRYNISGTELELVDSFVDLGILMDSELDFNNHIITMVNKAYGGILGSVCDKAIIYVTR